MTLEDALAAIEHEKLAAYHAGAEYLRYHAAGIRVTEKQFALEYRCSVYSVNRAIKRLRRMIGDANPA